MKTLYISEKQKRKARASENNQNGIVLILSLVFLCILALLGSTAVVLTTTDMKIGDNYKSNNQAFGAAQAGIQEARARMRGNADPSIKITYADPVNDSIDPDWETYIGTDTLAQNVSGYASGDTITPNIGTFTDIDYAVQIVHALDTQDLDSDGDTDEVLYWGDSDGDGNMERHTDATKNDPNIYLITSYGALITSDGSPTGANEVVQIEVTRAPTIPIKAALYTGFGANIKGSAAIDGNDQCGSDDKHGIATPLPSSTDPIDIHKPEMVTGLGGGTPSVQYEEDLINVSSLVASLKKSADFSYAAGDTYNAEDWGTPDLAATPPTCDTSAIVYFDSDIKISGNSSGCGILVVHGELDVTGTLDWYGIVLVDGKFKATGNVTIRGAVLADNDTDVDIITGSVDLGYCSSATENQAQNIPLRILSWNQP